MPTEKMGDLTVPQTHLAHWIRLRVFKGLGGLGMQKCWAGASFTWRTMNLTIYGKGVSIPDLPGQEPWVSKRVPVFKFQLYPGLLVQGEGGSIRLWFQVQLEIKFLSQSIFLNTQDLDSTRVNCNCNELCDTFECDKKKKKKNCPN